jgi:hypothetical protein
MKHFLPRLFIIGFLVNFFWEISQMGFYSQLGMGGTSNYWHFLKVHWYVSLMDAVMVVVLYFVVALIFKNNEWAKHPMRNNFVAMATAGAIWAIVIEYHAVYLTGRWGYDPLMPLLPILKVGLWPVLQMALLPSLAVYLSRSNNA